ncbi:MAG: hypothetical protein GY792_00565 [Gammaproteobacteria bacterium]|nr:hypothetical protein [Gammaproteobacteria bacterium]
MNPKRILSFQPLKSYASAIFFLLGFLLAACGSETPTTPELEVEVPFETLAQAVIPGTGSYYEALEPKLLVILKPDDLDALGNMISVQAQESLNALNFEKFLAVVVFSGDKRFSVIGIEISQVTLMENTIIVRGNFIEKHPEFAYPDTVISPYHVIKISRDELPENGEVFVLNGVYVPCIDLGIDTCRFINPYP